MKTLKEPFLDTPAEIYCVENQLVRALPGMARAATNTELAQTERPVQRVESVFSRFGEKVRAKKTRQLSVSWKEATNLPLKIKVSLPSTLC
jgi:ferritin-like metal-binding protein YciE